MTALANRWREIGARLFRRGRQALPVVVSLGLITWLIWKTTPERLLSAFAASNWPWLVLATAVQVIVLFTWDTMCLWWLFSQPNRRLPFRTVFRARTDTVIWSAVNLEIGQGVFAWKLARLVNDSVTALLGRCLLLALFDMGTLLSLALVGSFLDPEPLTRPLRWICVGGLSGLGALAVAVNLLPATWHKWLTVQAWAQWLTWFDWDDAVRLVLLRVGMFLLVLIYAGVGLAICGIPTDARTVLGVIPFVILAESLPGTGGLGERETALVYLVHATDEQRPVLLSFGLIWSTGVILGRILIGLASRWLPRRLSEDIPTAAERVEGKPPADRVGEGTGGPPRSGGPRQGEAVPEVRR